MAGKIRNLLGRLFGKKPAPPKLPKPSQGLPGHRGIAARDLKNPQLEQYREYVRRGVHEIPAEEVDSFLAGETPLFVASTNVADAMFYPDKNELEIKFISGGTYVYSNVSEQEAREFANSQSKGGYVWDRLRIRGTRTGHRKPYRKIG